MDDSANTPLKRCNKCNNEYPATTQFFHAQNQKKDGFHGTCKKCRSILEKERCEKQEHVIVIEKTCITCKISKPATHEFFHYASRARDGWQNECRECRRKRDDDRQKRFGDKKRAYAKIYSQSAQGKATIRKYIQGHRREAVARARRYAKRHPEKVRSTNRNYQARKRNTKGKHTAE